MRQFNFYVFLIKYKVKKATIGEAFNDCKDRHAEKSEVGELISIKGPTILSM